MEVGRVVAALKLAAQPPKAGTLVPADLRPRLVALTLEQLSPLSSSERWVIVLEALAFAPIHNEVVPAALPAKVSPELTATVTRLAPAIPRIAALFGVAVDPKARMPRPLRNEWRDKKGKKNEKKAGNGAPANGARGNAKGKGAPRADAAAPSNDAAAPADSADAPATADN